MKGKKNIKQKRTKRTKKNKKEQKEQKRTKKNIKPLAGLEPALFRLEVGRVIQLRHRGCICYTLLSLYFLFVINT